MKIFFASSEPAALKLNGEYAGAVNGFEQCADLDLKDNVFAEVCPAGGLPAGFFINEALLSSPPEFMDLYLLGGSVLISLHSFKSADLQLKIIFQTMFCGNLVTVFSQGEVYLSVEGQKYFFRVAGKKFLRVTAEEKTLAGYPVLALYGDNALILISHAGELIFENEVTNALFGQTLQAGLPLKTALGSVADCEYEYDGNELKLTSFEIRDAVPADENSIHIAFFETVLYSGDYKKYLSEELLPHAGSLREYLGNFTEVIVPMADFCAAHPGVCAAGLCYPVKPNLLNVKYFAAKLKDGKIDNIYSVG